MIYSSIRVVLRDVAKEQQESAVKTGKIDKSKVAFNRGGTVPGSAIYASNGMTVPGKGSRNVDSVSAMLALLVKKL